MLFRDLNRLGIAQCGLNAGQVRDPFVQIHEGLAEVLGMIDNARQRYPLTAEPIDGMAAAWRRGLARLRGEVLG